MKNHLLAMADLGKENVCPSPSSDGAAPAVAARALMAPHALRSGGRSPLPQGFPRAPLQDITHILSPLGPLNILADDYDDAPSCTARPKRSKSCSSTKTCSTRTLKSIGLSQCTSMKTIIKVSQPVLSDTIATVTEKADDFSQKELITVEERNEERSDGEVVKTEEKQLNISRNGEDSREKKQPEGRSCDKVLELKEECSNGDKLFSVERKSSRSDSKTVADEATMKAPQKRARKSNGGLTVEQTSKISRVNRRSEEKTRSSVLKFR